MSAARVNFSTFRSPGPIEVGEDDPYPLIRSALAPQYAGLAAEDVEAVLMQNGIRAAAMENFFSDVGSALSSAAKVVAPIAKKALPGVISGAAAGCALGPWGCLGGALVGGVTSALGSGGGGKPAGGSSGAGSIIAAAAPVIASAAGGGGVAGTLASALPAIAGLVSGGGGQPAPPQTRPSPPGDEPAPPQRRPAPPTGANNPAGVLLGLLQRPELIQSLMSMALGSAGREDVAVGDTPVPASAFANLLSVLGSKAFGQAEAWAEPSEALPDYLYTNGTLVVDPAAPTQRAARLLEMLGEVAVEAPPAATTSSFTEADEYYDSLDLAELDAMEMEGSDLEFDD